MKICLVTHYYDTHGGGVEIVARHIAQELCSREDVAITWVAGDVDIPLEVNARLKCVPVKVWNITENKLGIPYPFLSFGALKKLSREIKASDAVHIHDYLYPGNVFAFFRARALGKPVIITQHIGHIPYDNLFIRGLLTLFNKTLGRYILGHAGKTIFISETVREYFFPSENNINSCPVLIPNGVDLDVFSDVEEEEKRRIREKLMVDGGKPALLFVGRFVEKKGLSILEGLARRMSGVNWFFAGWGPLDPSSWGLKNVRVFYRADRDTVSSLYRVSDLLVLPSRGEGYPLVVQEAMASGTPAAVSDETARAFTPAEVHLFHFPAVGENALDVWADGLGRILGDPEKLKAMRIDVKVFARRTWCWKKCAESYYSVLKDSIDRRSR
ncbi:MAG: glycosyltransferase family 4 protein [Candidatus Omnitrophica bacterium]|nr:glycosyltransferase family 4 protein [Candidatus Omnitrophota bacterium]